MYVPQDTVELGGKFQQRRFSRLKHYDSRFGRNEERSVEALQDYRRYTPVSLLTLSLDILYDWSDLFGTGPKNDDVVDDAYDYLALMSLVTETLNEEPYGIENTTKALESQARGKDRAFVIDSEDYVYLEESALSYRAN